MCGDCLHALLTGWHRPSGGFEVVIEGAESSLKHLLDGFEERVVNDMKSFIQRVAGESPQSAQEIHLHRHVLQLIEVNIEEFQRVHRAQRLGKRVDAVSLHDENLQVDQILDLVCNGLQAVASQVEKDQTLHAVHAGGDVDDVVVAEIQFGQAVHGGQAGGEAGDLVVGQAEHLQAGAGAQLLWDLAQTVTAGKEHTQLLQQADLGRQAGQVVSPQVEDHKIVQRADGGGQGAQAVHGQVELLQFSELPQLCRGPAETPHGQAEGAVAKVDDGVSADPLCGRGHAELLLSGTLPPVTHLVRLLGDAA